MTFNSERLTIKDLSRDDLDLIHHLHSFPEVDEFNTLGIPNDISQTNAALQPYLEAQQAKPRKLYGWKIEITTTHEFVGMAGMTLSLDKFKSGEIFYKLLPKHWGKGYATEVASLLVKIGFENFQLHRVEAGVATENHRSIRVLEKAGMKREGLHRKILPIRGEWIDNYHYAIVEDDEVDF